MSKTPSLTGDLNWAQIGDEGLPDVVLLHSLGTGLQMWEGQFQPFSEVRRVLALDLPGHGRSNANPGEYRLEDLGGDVLGVADAAGIGRFDVCGISIGGLIGLWLAMHHPDRVRTLVACATSARLGNPQLWADRIKAVAAGGMEGIRAQVIPRFFSPAFARRDPETFARIEDMFLACDPAGYSACCGALRDADLREAVPTIRLPTLVVCGEEDVATPPSDAEWLHRNIAGSSLSIIPGAAHLPNVEQSEKFNRQVLAALGSGPA